MTLQTPREMKPSHFQKPRRKLNARANELRSPHPHPLLRALCVLRVKFRKALNTENAEGTEKTFERKQEELRLWNFPASDFRAETAARELHGDFGADGNPIGGVHHVSSGIRADGVAALQDAQRAALVELHAQRF